MTYSQEGASLKSHKLNGDHTKQLKYEVARIDLPTFSTSFTEDFHWRERENKTDMFEKNRNSHPDDLLSKPNQTNKICERQAGNFSDCSERFLLKNKSFSRQYAHLYAERLWEMRPQVVESAKEKWGI